LAPPTADAPHAQVEAVSVRLTKPGALAGAAVPSLEVHRRRAEIAREVERNPWGEVDVIHASHGCGIYRLRIAPGAAIPTHVHTEMEECELVLGPNLRVQGRPVPAGSAFRWPKDLPHRWENAGAVEATILCVDRPAFLRFDEVEVDHEGALPWIEPESFYPAAERAP